MQALNMVFSVSPWLGPDIRWEPETLVALANDHVLAHQCRERGPSIPSNSGR
jgi:hypothetical protein